jgi:hypothetical protein
MRPGSKAFNGAQFELGGSHNPVKLQSTKGFVSRWGHQVVLVDVLWLRVRGPAPTGLEHGGTVLTLPALTALAESSRVGHNRVTHYPDTGFLGDGSLAGRQHPMSDVKSGPVPLS